jgi:hypothetical protein
MVDCCTIGQRFAKENGRVRDKNKLKEIAVSFFLLFLGNGRTVVGNRSE